MWKKTQIYQLAYMYCVKLFHIYETSINPSQNPNLWNLYMQSSMMDNASYITKFKLYSYRVSTKAATDVGIMPRKTMMKHWLPNYRNKVGYHSITNPGQHPIARYHHWWHRMPVNTWSSVLLKLETLLWEEAGAEELQLAGTASVDMVTVSTLGAKGSWVIALCLFWD